MRTVIYEYGNHIKGITFSENLIKNIDGRGCFKLDVEISDKFNPYTTSLGTTAVEINGSKYMLNEVLGSNKGMPGMILPNGDLRLKVYSRKSVNTEM